MAPVPKYRQPANKEAHPPAVLNFPPPTPVLPSEAQVQANKLASAISASHQKQESAKSMAEEAAEKANEKASAARKSRIEELRAKVKSTKVKSTKVEVSGHAAKEGAEATAATAAADPSTTAAETDPLAKDLSKLSISPQAVQSPGGGGLQSPSSGAWKETGGTLEDSLRTTIQSPTSSSWKPPAETSLAQDTFAGAKVQSISAEEAKKVESQEMIKEEFEPASADSEKQKSVVKEEQKAEA